MDGTASRRGPFNHRASFILCFKRTSKSAKESGIEYAVAIGGWRLRKFKMIYKRVQQADSCRGRVL
jgi:hypothetical protein